MENNEKYITIQTNEQLKEFLLKYDSDENIGIEIDGSVGGRVNLLSDGELNFETLNEIGKNHTIKLKEKNSMNYDLIFLTKFMRNLPDSKKFVISQYGEMFNAKSYELPDEVFDILVLNTLKEKDVTIEGRYVLPDEIDERNRKMYSAVKLRRSANSYIRTI